MYKKLISIIIPVYNGEKYLKKCLESIHKQSYENLEIIVINDGSTDKSKEIAEEFYKKDARFKIVNIENGGVSNARKVGYELSTGEYISFVDADDWLELNYFTTLINYMTDDIDMVVCNYTTENKKICQTDDFLSKKIEKKEAYFMLATNDKFAKALWNKIYKKDIIERSYKKNKKNMFNPEIHVGEDFLFNATYLQFINKIQYVEIELYHYRINPQSVTQNKKINNKIITLLNAYSEIEKIYSKECKQYCEYIYMLEAKAKININYRIYYSEEKKKYYLLNSKKVPIIFKSKIVNFRDKFLIYMYMKCPKLIYKLKSFFY